MRTALSIAFWIYLALSSIVLFVVALAIFAATVPFDRRRRPSHYFSCAWASHYLTLNPLWRVRVVPGARFDRKHASIVVANHQSFADILVLYRTFLPFKWVSKQSVFKVPVIGWNMRLCGYVPLVRGDKSSVEKMAAECRKWLDRGEPILMFPEGTRSKDGNLQAYKPGAFRLAREAGVPVVPVVIDGTAEVLPKHGLTMRSTARIRVHVLDAVDVSGDASDEAAAERVRAIMADELERMRGARAA